MTQLVVSDNLTLRPLTIEDAAASFALVEKNRRYLAAWLPWVESLLTTEDEVAYISGAAAAIANGSRLEMGIFMTETTDASASKKSHDEAWKMIGTCGMVKIDRSHSEPFAELGYWLDEELTGRGIITKACKTIIQHAFTALNLTKVKIVSHKDNSSSISVAKRLNFQPVAEKVTDANMYHKDPSKMIVFTLYKRDWENTNS